MGMWRRCGEAASAAALYSVYSGLYSEAVVSSDVSAVALVDVGRFREAIEYVQKAAKTLYEAVKEVFERVKMSLQRLVELFVEAVARVLAWVDKHKAYLFLMAAAAAGVIALSVALNMWGLIELEKLAYAASAAPFFAGLADAGGKAAERFKALGERYERWRVDESLIDEVLNVPLRGERPYAAFLKLARSRRGLTPPLVELRKALINVKGEVEKDAVVVAALVLYKALINNAEAYREWAGWYGWARGLVGGKEFTVATEEVKRLREAQRRLEGVAGRVLEELNRVLVLYSQSGFYKEADIKKLKSLLEVNLGEAEELAKARSKELSKYSDANMGTKAYAALLSLTRGGIYGHTAMLLMGEGALADVVLLAPVTACDKAWKIAKGRGRSVGLSRVGASDWEDRVASVLLRFFIGYGEADLKFRRVEKGDEKGRVVRGFQVFRAYGGVEAPVGELWIGESAARFNVSEEELRRRVEEAKRTAPDLTGLDKAPQYLAWRATDVTTSEGRIVAGTVHSWQLAWYFGLLGEPKSFSGSASVTKKGIKLAVTVYWSREREDQILRESRWLKSLLNQQVESWQQLVDAIDWSWVLKKVKELADEVEPWIGSEEASDAEREGLARRMLGELALLTHFAEARRGKNDGEWREERVKRLARAVEALSGGRIAGNHAEELARAIIYYAEGYKKEAERRIKSLAEKVGVSREDVWSVVEFILGDMYCLARDCARDAVVRKFVEPSLELIMLDKALRGKFSREEALLYFGEMYATAIAGDGHVGSKRVELTIGGELGGGAALLRLAALHLLNRLMPDELKFNVRIHVVRDTYRIAARGDNAARLIRLLAVSAPSASGECLSEKFDEFVEVARVEVRPGDIWLTDRGHVAADLTISEGGIAVKYNVYVRNTVVLQFVSTDRSHAELAARLLRLAGVGAEVKKEDDRDKWRIEVSTDVLAAGREELRKALAEIVKRAVENGWVDAGRAEGWLKKLERGRVLKEGWPKYYVGLKEGAVVVRFASPNPASIEREVQRLNKMGLEEGKHFTAKMPEEDRDGYVSILKEGLAYASWLSIHGSGVQQRLAAEFVNYILQRAKRAGEEVYEKVREIIEEGKARGSLTLKGFEKKVEMGSKQYVVKVIDGGAEPVEKQDGKKLLRIKITAGVDGVRREYEITFGRYGRNAAVGRAVARADAPGGREADAERLSALIKALTGKEPGVYRTKDGKIMIVCYEGHLKGFMRYTELADAIAKWLKETGR